MIFDLVVVGVLKVVVWWKWFVYNEKDMFVIVFVDNYLFFFGYFIWVVMVVGLFLVFLNDGFWRIFIGFWVFCVLVLCVIFGRYYVSDVLCGFVIGLL